MLSESTSNPLDPDPGVPREGERLTILTGATGFLGREILATLLANRPGERVLVILRGSPNQSAKQRLAELLTRMYEDDEERLQVAGRVDVGEADLGRGEVTLEGAVWEMLRGRVIRIIHGAASVTLDLPLEEARAINVGGTQRMLNLAVKISEIATLECFAYIGTAFVAGERKGRIGEDELDVGQGFHNTYERSKCDAEKLVRTYQDRLPISIFRPSIIAGHSTTGVTTTFSKVLYWPARVFASGLVLCIPGDPEARYDLVPVDFVAAALTHIVDQKESVGRCYHLTAGSTITLRRAVHLCAELFGVKRIPPFISPRLFFVVVRPLFLLTLFGKWREVLTRAAVIVPYLTCQLSFDTRNTTAALAGSGLLLPDTETYLKTILSYVKENDWGRRTLPAGSVPRS